MEIRAVSVDVDIEQLHIDCFCGTNRQTFANTVTVYRESAIAFFCEDATYLLCLRPGTSLEFQLSLCPCSRELLNEYTRQYPLQNHSKIICIYENNNLQAIRIDFPEGHFYMMATKHNEIELQLSDKLYNPLEYSFLPCMVGKHMEFVERKER